MIPLVLSFTSLALAADQSTLAFLGFSKDGKYAAYEQYGVQDGSGFPYSEIVVLNVSQSKTVISVKKVIQTENSGVKEARAQAVKAAALGRYGIQIKNLGRTVYASPLGKSTVQFQAKSRAYQMGVLPVTFKTKDCISPSAKGVRVQLNKKVIFKDAVLPKDRYCAQKYAIQQVRLWDTNKSFIAFLRYEKDGFEGPDVRYWAVTGILP